MQKNITNTANNMVSQGHDVRSLSESKRQKIVAAIHLVTSHLHVDEPLRASLRSCALSFISSRDAREEKDVRARLLSLLSVGSLTGLVSAKNASIIEREIVALEAHVSSFDEYDVSTFFGQEGQSVSDTSRHMPLSAQHSQRHYSLTSNIKKTTELHTSLDQGHERKDITEIKKERKQKILDYINSKRAAVIKDIIALFPEVSEKTIQRELNVLLEEGKIEKRGDKRWSLYVAKALTS
jgi:hypothetical protein